MNLHDNVSIITTNIFTEIMALETNDTVNLDISVTGRIIQRIILPIICAAGIFGIVLTLIVLSRKSMHTSTNCYLMALATTDLLFLLNLATTLLDNQFVLFSKQYYLFVIYVTYSAIFMQIFLLASVWLTVILSVERFIGICRPYLSNSLCTVNRARLVIIFIFIIAAICRSPNFLETHIRSAHDHSLNASLTYIEGSALSTDENYIVWYPLIIDGVITSMLPFLILVVLNVRLILEVKKSTKYLQMNQMLTQSETSITIQKEEFQVTVILVSVIIVFFICQAPYVIYTAVVSIYNFVLHSHYLMVFRHITVLMLALKSAINFVLYCWFSEKFLTSLRKLFAVKNRLKNRNFRRSNSGFSQMTSSVRSATTLV